MAAAARSCKQSTQLLPPLLVALSAVSCASQLACICTVAGNSTAGYSGNGGPATTATLNQPQGIVLDGTGGYIFVEFGAHVVRRVSATGVISVIAGTGTAGYTGDGGAATAARLNAPAGIALDDALNVFVAEYRSSVIRRISSNGFISTIAGNGSVGYAGDRSAASSAMLRNPSGVTVDAMRRLTFADGVNDAIRAVDTNGVITTLIGNGTASSTGTSVALATVNNPRGVYVDGLGSLLIAEFSGHIVRQVTANGVVSIFAGNRTRLFAGDGAPATLAALNNPREVTADGAGGFYIVETGSHVVRRVDASGRILTVAGIGTVSGYTGDGDAATAATLFSPQGIVIDGEGGFLVSDTANNVIRYVTPPGMCDVAFVGCTFSSGVVCTFDNVAPYLLLEVTYNGTICTGVTPPPEVVRRATCPKSSDASAQLTWRTQMGNGSTVVIVPSATPSSTASSTQSSTTTSTPSTSSSTTQTCTVSSTSGRSITASASTAATSTSSSSCASSTTFGIGGNMSLLAVSSASPSATAPWNGTIITSSTSSSIASTGGTASSRASSESYATSAATVFITPVLTDGGSPVSNSSLLSDTTSSTASNGTSAASSSSGLFPAAAAASSASFVAIIAGAVGGVVSVMLFLFAVAVCRGARWRHVNGYKRWKADSAEYSRFLRGETPSQTISVRTASSAVLEACMAGADAIVAPQGLEAALVTRWKQQRSTSTFASSEHVCGAQLTDAMAMHVAGTSVLSPAMTDVCVSIAADAMQAHVEQHCSHEQNLDDAVRRPIRASVMLAVSHALQHVEDKKMQSSTANLEGAVASLLASCGTHRTRATVHPGVAATATTAAHALCDTASPLCGQLKELCSCIAAGVDDAVVERPVPRSWDASFVQHTSSAHNIVHTSGSNTRTMATALALSLQQACAAMQPLPPPVVAQLLHFTAREIVKVTTVTTESLRDGSVLEALSDVLSNALEELSVANLIACEPCNGDGEVSVTMVSSGERALSSSTVNPDLHRATVSPALAAGMHQRAQRACLDAPWHATPPAPAPSFAASLRAELLSWLTGATATRDTYAGTSKAAFMPTPAHKHALTASRTVPQQGDTAVDVTLVNPLQRGSTRVHLQRVRDTQNARSAGSVSSFGSLRQGGGSSRRLAFEAAAASSSRVNGRARSGSRAKALSTLGK